MITEEAKLIVLEESAKETSTNEIIEKVELGCHVRPEEVSVERMLLHYNSHCQP